MKLRDLWPFGRKSVSNSLELWREIGGGRAAETGDTISWKTAIQVATVFACARSIANGISQVPLKLFRESPDGLSRVPATDHDLYRLLHRRPNPWQTSFAYRQTLALHLVLCGNHYSYKNRASGGRIGELIPLEPQWVRVRQERDASLLYDVTMPGGETRTLSPEAIWHVRGPSWNGWQGMEAVALAREAIGLSMATERQASRMHKNGLSPTGAWSVDDKLGGEQYKQLAKQIQDRYGGSNNGAPLILDRGAKWLSLTMTGVDAQHLETRRFQVEEVCRAMGVMPIMVGHADKTATYASAEQMFIAHVVHTLSPWYECIEQAIDVDLLTERDTKNGIYAKFVAAGLLRGSMKDRAEYFAKALGAGGAPAWMTQDEVRALEELNPMGGDAAVLPKPTNVPGTPKPTEGNEE